MPEKLLTMPGSVPVNKNERVGPADPKTVIDVTLKLRRKSEDGLPTLEQFVAGQRARLTRQQLADNFGTSQADADTVKTWAAAQGLEFVREDLGRRQVHIKGSIDAMSAAFGVTLSLYTHKRTGLQFRCPEGDVTLPESLHAIVTGVFGLNDMPIVVRTRHRSKVVPTNAEAADPKQTFAGTYYPNEVAKLYSFPNTTGAGQKVAILEFGGGFDQTQLDSYFKTNIGLAASPTVNGISILNQPIQVDQDVTGEVYLDIEVVGAMAPGATQDVYFAPWTGAGYLNAIDEAVQADDYAAVSISYGLDEDMAGDAQDPAWPMLNQNVDEAFRDATAIGLPVFVSSGDQGSSSGRGSVNNQEVTLYEPQCHVEYPSSSPYATAVGGTMLYSADGQITNEIVWNELGQLVQNKYYYGGCTGGGVSDRYTTVPSYQTKAGVQIASANDPTKTGRAVPDVSGNSGSTTGYLVTQPPGGQYPIAPVGGTSAAAPMWAALMACVRESLSTTFQGKIPIYFINDFIYANGTSAAFRDIVAGRTLTYTQTGIQFGPITEPGNNQSSATNGYTAQKGYDCCTGWGSPNGQELLTLLTAWLKTQPTGSSSP